MSSPKGTHLFHEHDVLTWSLLDRQIQLRDVLGNTETGYDNNGIPVFGNEDGNVKEETNENIPFHVFGLCTESAPNVIPRNPNFQQ